MEAKLEAQHACRSLRASPGVVLRIYQDYSSHASPGETQAGPIPCANPLGRKLGLCGRRSALVQYDMVESRCEPEKQPALDNLAVAFPASS